MHERSARIQHGRHAKWQHSHRYKRRVRIRSEQLVCNFLFAWLWDYRLCGIEEGED